MTKNNPKLIEFIQVLKCFIGLHRWGKYGSTVNGDCHSITFIWWECHCCGHSKLKCIFHNGKSND